MAKDKNKKLTLDERLVDLKKQQKDLMRLIDKVQGAIEYIELMKNEYDEKRD